MSEGVVAARLAERGLSVPEVVKPVAAYVPALRTGSYVYVSGQLPVRAGEPTPTGRVGEGDGLVSPEAAKHMAQACALNAIAAIASVVDLDKVTQVVKLTGFVASDPSFTGQPGVINGASELFVAAFGDAGKHARSAVGVVALPLDVPVEVDVIVEVAD